jgi:hypothetical protein
MPLGSFIYEFIYLPEKPLYPLTLNCLKASLQTHISSDPKLPEGITTNSILRY